MVWICKWVHGLRSRWRRSVLPTGLANAVDIIRCPAARAVTTVPLLRAIPSLTFVEASVLPRGAGRRSRAGTLGPQG